MYTRRRNKFNKIIVLAIIFIMLLPASVINSKAFENLETPISSEIVEPNITENQLSENKNGLKENILKSEYVPEPKPSQILSDEIDVAITSNKIEEPVTKLTTEIEIISPSETSVTDFSSSSNFQLENGSSNEIEPNLTVEQTFNTDANIEKNENELSENEQHIDQFPQNSIDTGINTDTPDGEEIDKKIPQADNTEQLPAAEPILEEDEPENINPSKYYGIINSNGDNISSGGWTVLKSPTVLSETASLLGLTKYQMILEYAQIDFDNNQTGPFIIRLNRKSIDNATIYIKENGVWSQKNTQLNKYAAYTTVDTLENPANIVLVTNIESQLNKAPVNPNQITITNLDNEDVYAYQREINSYDFWQIVEDDLEISSTQALYNIYEINPWGGYGPFIIQFPLQQYSNATALIYYNNKWHDTISKFNNGVLNVVTDGYYGTYAIIVDGGTQKPIVPNAPQPPINPKPVTGLTFEPDYMDYTATFIAKESPIWNSTINEIGLTQNQTLIELFSVDTPAMSYGDVIMKLPCEGYADVSIFSYSYGDWSELRTSYKNGIVTAYMEVFGGGTFAVVANSTSSSNIPLNPSSNAPFFKFTGIDGEEIEYTISSITSSSPFWQSIVMGLNLSANQSLAYCFSALPVIFYNDVTLQVTCPNYVNADIYQFLFGKWTKLDTSFNGKTITTVIERFNGGTFAVVTNGVQISNPSYTGVPALNINITDEDGEPANYTISSSNKGSTLWKSALNSIGIPSGYELIDICTVSASVIYGEAYGYDPANFEITYKNCSDVSIYRLSQGKWKKLETTNSGNTISFVIKDFLSETFAIIAKPTVTINDNDKPSWDNSNNEIFNDLALRVINGISVTDSMGNPIIINITSESVQTIQSKYPGLNISPSQILFAACDIQAVGGTPPFTITIPFNFTTINGRFFTPIVYHYVNNGWEKLRTSYINGVAKAYTDSFSPFVIVLDLNGSYYSDAIDIPSIELHNQTLNTQQFQMNQANTNTTLKSPKTGDDYPNTYDRLFWLISIPLLMLLIFQVRNSRVKNKH